MQKGQKWPNVSIPKSAVGEPVVRLVFETGEILRLKMYFFEWKRQPTQTRSL